MEREKLPYCILRNYQNVYDDNTTDIDLVVEEKNVHKFRTCLGEAAAETSHQLVHQARYVNYSFVYGHADGTLLRIDVEMEVRWRFFPALTASAVIGLRQKQDLFYVPHPRHESVVLFIAAIWRNALPDRYREQLGNLFKQIPNVRELEQTFRSVFGRAGKSLVEAQRRMAAGEAPAVPLRAARRALIFGPLRSPTSRPQFLRFLADDLRRFVGRVVTPPGISVVFISSGASRQVFDSLFHKIEFLYPVKKSELSFQPLDSTASGPRNMSLALRLSRLYTLFKGGLFMRYYEVRQNEHLGPAILDHSQPFYASRSFVCAQSSDGSMTIRHLGTGLVAESRPHESPGHPHDELLQFIRVVLQRKADVDLKQYFARVYSAPRLLSVRRLVTSALWLLLIASLAFLSLNFLKDQARSIADDTLPGLTFAGSANANLAQAFNRTLVLLMTEDPVEKQRIIAEIQHFSNITTELLTSYKQSITSTRDSDLFRTLLSNRSTYLDIRREVLSLAKQGRTPEATKLCHNQLLPAYYRYKAAGDAIFAFNIREGETRGRRIMKVCTITQWTVAGIVSFVFVIGFAIGLSRKHMPPDTNGNGG